MAFYACSKPLFWNIIRRISSQMEYVEYSPSRLVSDRYVPRLRQLRVCAGQGVSKVEPRDAAVSTGVSK